MRKACTLFTIVCFFLLAASCNNIFNASIPPPAATHEPVDIQSLKFSPPKKIALADVKTAPARPTVTRLAWDKLPQQPEDTTGFKPFKYPVQETKFDYNSLPGKALDIDKLLSHPLKFKTYLLPPPRLVKGIKPEIKNGHLYLLAVGSEQTTSVVATTRLLRDKDGFLWIACSEGIYRYDGENLLLFLAFPDERSNYGMIQDSEGNFLLPDPDGPLMILEPNAGILKKALPNQDASGFQHLLLDGQQRIWATTQSDEVKIIDTKTQTIKVLNNKNGLSPSNRTAGLAMDKNGKIWISTSGGGIDVVDPANKEIKYFDEAHGLKTNRVNNIAFDHKGRLWVGMVGGSIQVIDQQKKSLQTISELQSAAPRLLVPSWAEDANGRTWVGTTLSGATAIDLEKRLLRRIDKTQGLAVNRVFDIRPDDNGQVWIGTDGGLNMLADEREVREHNGSNTVNNLMEDRHGLIWQATSQGIDILDRKKHISRHLGVKQGLANDTVYFVEEKNGAFFISTAASMEILDTAKKTITHFESNYSNILFDKAGRVYFLDHTETGINIYDPKNKTLRYLSRQALQLNEAIYFLNLDTLGRIWTSNSRGEVTVIDPDAGTIQSLTNLTPEKKDNWVHFLPDSQGNMWMGSGRGVYIADIRNQKLIHFSRPQGLIGNKVLSLLQYNRNIYAGTSHGVTVITPPAEGVSANKNWRAISYAFNKQDANNYSADVVTRDGLYWSGDAGARALNLSKIDSPRSVPYIKGISLYDRPLYFYDKTKFNADTLWRQNGETHFLKGETPANLSYAFKSGLRWDDVAGPADLPVNLQIPYNQNFLHFHYGNINLTPHDTTRYRYILNGFDKNWSDATSDTVTVNYMNLPPGSYSFEVMSRNAVNAWSLPARFNFTINPPWWQTWWAYVIYAALFVSAISGFVRFRSLQLIKEKHELENKVRLATEEILQQNEEIAAQRDSLESQRNDLEKTLSELKTTQTQLIQSEKMASLGELTAGIAHEIQNPLNFVNNFSEVSVELLEELKAESRKLKGERDEKLEAELIDDLIENQAKINHHGKRADSIVKGMLEHSRASTGQKEPTDLNKLVDEYMRLAYHGLRAKDKSFNAELISHFDEKLPKANVIPQDMGRVLLNLFNNAFYAVKEKAKTAGPSYKPTVQVTTFTPPSGGWGVSVHDNGNGIPDSVKDKIMQPFFTTKPTGEGTGLGLSLSYDIVVKGHGGHVAVNSVVGEGSEFIISLPEL